MSLFGTQYSSLGKDSCGKPKLSCCTTSLPRQSQNKTVLLQNCQEKPDCCSGELPCYDNACCEPEPSRAQSDFVEGERVLRPWALDKCDPCRPKPKPKCNEAAQCHHRKSKVLECRTTECLSAVVKLLVHGGPDQTLKMFIDLPQCEEQCDEVVFKARYLIVGEGKCQE